MARDFSVPIRSCFGSTQLRSFLVVLASGQATHRGSMEAGRLCVHQDVLEILIALLAFVAVVVILQVLERSLVDMAGNAALDSREEDNFLVCTRVSDDDVHERMDYGHVWPTPDEHPAHARRRRRAALLKAPWRAPPAGN